MFEDPDSHYNTIEAVPYLEPVTVTRTFVRNDYEPPPVIAPNSYDMHLPNHYETIDTTSVRFTNKSYQLNGVLPDDESIYEDPGHVKENIYVWFKRKNICKLKKNHIRYIFYIVIFY